MSGGKVLVVGLGVSGSAAARMLQEEGHQVAVLEDAWTPELARRKEDMLGVEVHLGGWATLTEVLSGVRLVVVSPGVPPAHPVFDAAREREIPVWSEIELAYRACRAPIVAVTGTNGKTTVVTLLGRILESAGMRAVVCGNIGPPMITSVRDVPSDGVVVAEVSSFQLAMTHSFRARAGLFLNAAEDHLDWHATFGEYADAKARVWSNQDGSDLAVANAEDDATLARLRLAPGRHAVFASSFVPDVGAGYSGGILTVQGLGPPIELLDVSRRPDLAAHDRSNLAAAAVTAVDLGVNATVIQAEMETFRPPAHRREHVADREGVTFVDDSKATNPHAAMAAIRAYPTVVLIAGGRNKGMDLGVLGEVAEHVRAVVAVGEASPDVEKAFVPRNRTVVRADSMPAAVRAAFDLAEAGDVVLLSPACASFDWYGSYAERGDAFAAAVHALAADGGER